jgi:hypothetical protein
MCKPLTASAAAVLAFLGGCGGGDEKAAPKEPAAAPQIPACAKAPPRVPRPADLPPNFPLPPGTVLTHRQNPYPGQLLIAGVIPADLREAASFFADQLPARGYNLGVGDAEQGEAEAPFTGHGLRGKWRVNGILDCPTAVTLTLVLIKQS